MDVDVQQAEEVSPPAGPIVSEGWQEHALDVEMTGGNDLFAVPGLDNDELLPDVNLDMEESEMEAWDQQLGASERAIIDAYFEQLVRADLPPIAITDDDTDMPDLPRELANQQPPVPIEVSSETALKAFESDPGLLGEDNVEEEEQDDLDGDSDVFLDPELLNLLEEEEEEEEEITTDKQPAVAATGEEQETPINPQLAEGPMHAPPAPQETTPEPESDLVDRDPAKVEAPEEDLSTTAVEPAAASEQQAPASPPLPPSPAPTPAPATNPAAAVMFGGMWFPGGNMVQQTAPNRDEEEPQQPAEETRTSERTPEAAIPPRQQQDGDGPQAAAPEPPAATPSRGMPPRRKPKTSSMFMTPRRRPQASATAASTRNADGGSADRDRAARNSLADNLMRRDVGLPAGAGPSLSGTRILPVSMVLGDQGKRSKEEFEEAKEKEAAALRKAKEDKAERAAAEAE